MNHLNEEHVLVQSINNLVKYINGTFVPTEMRKHYGLCVNVLHEDLDVSALICTWHENGTYLPCFPIEGDTVTYFLNKRKNDRRTIYGKKRLRLAEYLLINLQEELELY